MNFQSLLYLAIILLTGCGKGDHSFNIQDEGGTEIIVEPNVSYFLQKQAGFTNEPTFKEALNQLNSHQTVKGPEFIKLFLAKLQELKPGRHLASYFATTNKSKYDYKMSNTELEKKLIEAFSLEMDRAEVVLKARFEKFGLEQFNVINLGNAFRIELGGEYDLQRIRGVVQAYANFGFYMTHDPLVVYEKYLIQADKILAELASSNDTIIQRDSTLDESRDANHPILKYLYPNLQIGERGRKSFGSGALIGWVQSKDTSVFLHLLKSDPVRLLLPRDLHFAFAYKTEEQGMGLYCIKGHGINSPEIDQESVTSAHLSKNESSGSPTINLQFNVEAADKWAQLTRENIGKSILVVLDKSVLMAPFVESEIPNGNTVISGNFTLQEAQDLAGILNVGSMPLPLRIVSETTIKK